MAPPREELERWLREDRLAEGAQWYLVAAEWWRRAFPAESADGSADGERDGDGDQPMADASDADSKRVRNAPLVDEAYSSASRGCVVLKPQLAEECDYRVVSERVWNVLSHEFGFDWEIAREVVRTRGDKLRVEVYPTMFQLLFWRSDMEEPGVVEETAAGRPFVLLAIETVTLQELQSQVRSALLPRLREFFPGIELSEVDSELQMAYRVEETEPWTPFTEAESATTVGALALEPRDYKQGDERFHHLLVETRFRNGDETPKNDWRVGRFYSDIKANVWRFQLQQGQLVDALDTDKKWYESRVVELSPDQVKVHYRGWTEKWDEWLDRLSPRIQPLHTRVPNWRDFRVGDDVQVGMPQAGRSFPQWRNEKVLEVEKNEQDGSVRIRVTLSGRENWMDAQDEMLCRVGTHKAVNAVPTSSTLTTARPSFYNDRRDYSYEPGRGKPDYLGVVGLSNLGNTCFMNSMLQCLNNAKPLKDYFLARGPNGEPLFEKDVNEDNPLGMKGMIAREFAKLIKRMWGGEHTMVAPTGLKSVIGQYAPQFAGYQQQDSQEVMNFILDGLHEDLNRVRKKPYTTPVERNGRGDDEVAQEEWTQYLRRNDSVVVENFMGQLRSHVTCSNSDCANESITFDPFMSLSVPIPSDESVPVKVQLFWADGSIPMKYAVRVEKDATIGDVKEKLSALCGVPPKRLFFVDVRGHRIKKIFRDAVSIDDLMDDVLHVYELELPVDEYEFCSSNLRPHSSLVPSPPVRKSHRLVALLHQAPVASPVDAHHREDERDGFVKDGAYGSKQRRVEVELFNTPLLLSIDTDLTKEQVHRKVWQVVKRLVADDSSYGCSDEKPLPYRIHITRSSGLNTTANEFLSAAEPAGLPQSGEDFYFTLEWSRKGYQKGYDEKSAKRIEIHESMRLLKISPNQQDDVTLLKCLTKFTEREQLGKTDTWYCPKCKEHVRAFKKFDLFSLPKVLIFHLKRFRYAQSSFYMHRDKITTLVTFPIESLDLRPFVVGPQRNNDLVYDLFAVSEHSGGLGGGHYTAVGKNPENGRWFSYNDSFTKEASPDDAVTSRAYVLFYVRRE